VGPISPRSGLCAYGGNDWPENKVLLLHNHTSAIAVVVRAIEGAVRVAPGGTSFSRDSCTRMMQRAPRDTSGKTKSKGIIGRSLCWDSRRQERARSPRRGPLPSARASVPWCHTKERRLPKESSVAMASLIPSRVLLVGATEMCSSGQSADKRS
jgi:hypothetical protein